MLDIDISNRATLDDLRRIAGDQAPFGFSLGINKTMFGAQDAIRELVPREFTINASRVKFIQALVRFPKRLQATKRNLSATMGVHAKDGDVGVGSDKDRGFLLGRHEETHTATRPDPLRPFYIPTDEIRGGAYDVAPASLRPISLGLMEGRGIVSYTTTVDAKTGKTKRKGIKGTKLINSTVTARGKVRILGKRNTFLIGPMNDANPKDWGIYQRMGPGRRDIRLIWAMRTRIQIHERLHFYGTFVRYVDAHLDEQIVKAIDYALATAK